MKGVIFRDSSPCIIFRGVRGGKKKLWAKYWAFIPTWSWRKSFIHCWWRVLGIFYFSGSWIRSWMSSIHRFIWMLKYCPNLESSDPMNLPFWVVVGTLPFKTNTNHPQDKLLMISFNFTSTISKRYLFLKDGVTRGFFPHTLFFGA